MKRVAIVLAIVFLAPCVWAQNFTASQEYSYVIENTTVGSKCHIIPITSIRPKVDKLVAYRVSPCTGATACEVVASIFDGTDVTLSGELLGESESVAPTTAGERWVRPKKIVNGLVTLQGARTVLTLFFVRE